MRLVSLPSATSSTVNGLRLVAYLADHPTRGELGSATTKVHSSNHHRAQSLQRSTEADTYMGHGELSTGPQPAKLSDMPRRTGSAIGVGDHVLTRHKNSSRRPPNIHRSRGILPGVRSDAGYLSPRTYAFVVRLRGSQYESPKAR